MAAPFGLRFSTPAAAAFDYADLGIPVFPVAHDGRTPLTPHGYKDATTDRAVVTQLWAGRPFLNVAMATGGSSGLFVVDLDEKGGKSGLAVLAALEDRHGSLPIKTICSRTPSGGRHLFFRQPAARLLRNRVDVPIEGFPLTGIDVRTTGGSVVLPPSQKPAGPYVWIVDPLLGALAEAPDWLLDLIDPPICQPARRLPMKLTRTSLDRTARYVCAVVNGECDTLAAMAPGSGRNQQLFKAAARLGALIAASVLFRDIAEAELEDAAGRCGLVREDGLRAIRATIASGLQRGMMSPATVPA